MKKTIIILFHLLLFVAYFFIFPVEGELEACVIPEWSVSVDEAVKPLVQNADIVPFETESNFGFISSDGNISYRENKQYGVVLRKDQFISYSWVSNNLVVRDNAGSIINSVDIHAYPVSIADRYFAVSSDRSIIYEFDLNGEILWSKQFINRISSMDADKENLLLGFLDSDILLLDNAGEEIFSFNTKGSRINIVYSVLLTDNSESIIAVAGIDPQKIVFLKKEKGVFKFKKEVLLASDLRREILAGNLENTDLFYVEQEKAVMFYKYNAKYFSEESTGYLLDDINLFDSENELYYMLSSDSSNSELKLFTPGRETFVTYKFNEPNIKISLFKDGVLFVKGNQLFKLNMLNR